MFIAVVSALTWRRRLVTVGIGQRALRWHSAVDVAWRDMTQTQSKMHRVVAGCSAPIHLCCGIDSWSHQQQISRTADGAARADATVLDISTFAGDDALSLRYP